LNKDGDIVWKIHSTEKKWKLNKKGQEKVLESLPEFLKKFSESSRRVDLQIAKSMDKEDVIGKGPEIADDISVVFESLFPLYEASVS
jgi:hypothetical protein